MSEHESLRLELREAQKIRLKAIGAVKLTAALWFLTLLFISNRVYDASNPINVYYTSGWITTLAITILCQRFLSSGFAVRFAITMLIVAGLGGVLAPTPERRLLILVAGGFYAAAFFGILIAAGKVYRWMRFRPSVDNARSLLVTSGLALLDLLRDPSFLEFRSTRWHAVWNLELLARGAERTIAYFATSELSVAFRDKAADLGRGVSSAVREWKLWLLTPQHQTRVQLEDKIRTLLLVFIRGEWHHLPRSEPPRLTTKGILQRVLHVVLGLFRSAVPLAAVILWKQTGIGYDPALYTRLVPVAALVGLLQLLFLLDPTGKDKIGSTFTLAKDLTAIRKDDGK